MLRPKKRLGQHFLTDRNIASRITAYIKANDYHKLIEVGPGKGILTGFLLERHEIEVFPVEIDHEAVEYLLAKWPGLNGIIKEADFLSLDLPQEYGNKFGIIGNFPYNISSQIFFKVLEYKDNCREVVCMIQKEVADRIISPPGNKTYGILSVLLQTWYKIDYLFTVNPGSFFPPPEVRSAVIRLVRNEREDLPVDQQFFNRFVKAAFNQRRKMLRNSIRSFSNSETEDNPILKKRPEQLSVDEFLDLAVWVSDHNKKKLN
jgi:16S rRNA (adenine1518-N6/adenine1519-N6)-dimethyltransferase